MITVASDLGLSASNLLIRLPGVPLLRSPSGKCYLETATRSASFSRTIVRQRALYPRKILRFQHGRVPKRSCNVGRLRMWRQANVAGSTCPKQ